MVLVKRSFRGTNIYFYRRPVTIHSFNGTVYFSDVKICSHSLLPAYIVPAYLRTPVTMKQTTHRISYIFGAFIKLKWEQPFLWISYFFSEIIFSEHLGVWNTYFLPITTFWYIILFLISYFEDRYSFSTATASEELLL